MTTGAFALALLMAAQVGSQTIAPADALVEAKRLYAAGAYEDALGRLSGGSQGTPEADQYRALCQLALGRSDDAKRSLEDLIARNPFFKMPADVSPRLITMFQEARRRLLPASAKRLYTDGKQAFEEGHYRQAATQFREVLTLIADEDFSKEAAAGGDLKMLSEGFLRLADAEVKAAIAAAAAAAPPPSPVAAAPAAPAPPRIYSLDDPDVVGPVAVTRVFPAWTPKTPAEMRGLYQGMLRIVISESGAVESATILKSVFATYDALLLEAARGWQFRPATRNGQAVRYQQTIPVTLASGGASAR